MTVSFRDLVGVARRTAMGTVVGVLTLVAAGPAQAFDRESLVSKKCTACHAAGADGRIARVEDIRTTPEEWAVIVDRMKRLHGMEIKDGEMDRLLKELCATQILTPDEQAKVAYLSLWHNSQQMEVPAGKDEEKLFTTCVRCHTEGKIRSYRMTAESWTKLRDFHLYIVPTVVFQMREMRWIPEADAALASWASKLPYGKAWSAPEAKLAGNWAVFGYEPGRGSYRGEARITDAGNGEYKLAGSLAYADGTSAAFAGDATLYGGYALRTRTKHNGFASNGAYIVSGDELRGESHLPAPNFRTSSATWLRAGDAVKVARIVPAFLLKGEKTTLTVEGLNLPDAKPADITFGGAPVKVLSAKRVAPGALELVVMSDADKLGTAKVTVKGIDAGTIRLAPQIDHIAIAPEMGRARLSGGGTIRPRASSSRRSPTRKERAARRRPPCRWGRSPRRSGSPTRRRVRTTTTSSGRAASRPTARTCRWATTVRTRCATTRARTAASSKSSPNTSAARRRSRRRRCWRSRCPTSLRGCDERDLRLGRSPDLRRAACGGRQGTAVRHGSREPVRARRGDAGGRRALARARRRSSCTKLRCRTARCSKRCAMRRC